MLTARPRASDAGISLVEVMVAMVVTAIVGSMMLTYLISTVHSARRADGQNEQAAGARVALASWAAIVPLAVDPNGESGPTSVRFYSIGPTSAKFCIGLGTKSTNPAIPDAKPRGVEIALVGGQLVENRWPTCAAMVASGAYVHRVLAQRAQVVATGAWLLTPLASTDLPAGGVSSGLVTSTLAVGQTPLSALDPDDSVQIAKITSLQLAFRTLAAPSRPAPPATYTTLLALAQGG